MSSIAWGKMHKDATTVLEGDFLAVIEKATAGQSQNGNPSIKAVVKITQGPYTGRSIPANFTLTDKAMGMFFKNMKDLGLDEAFFQGIDGQGMEPVAAAISGLAVEIKVVKGSWNGQERENISQWKRVGSTGLPVSAATSLPSAAATLPSAAQPVAAVAVAVSAPPAAPGEGDNVDPF